MKKKEENERKNSTMELDKEGSVAPFFVLFCDEQKNNFENRDEKMFLIKMKLNKRFLKKKKS